MQEDLLASYDIDQINVISSNSGSCSNIRIIISFDIASDYFC
jgi:hypothetical protein